jgi:hypothetical protein
MASLRMTLLDLLNKSEQGWDPNFLRDGVQLLAQELMLSVVQEAYIHGVSTRAVDNLAEALGIKSISKDQVSRICKELDAQVHAFRTRRLDGEFPIPLSGRHLREGQRERSRDLDGSVDRSRGSLHRRT